MGVPSELHISGGEQTVTCHLMSRDTCYTCSAQALQWTFEVCPRGLVARKGLNKIEYLRI